MRAAGVLIALALALAVGSPGTARANILVADLSDYLISISSTFAGTQIHAFGLVDLADDPASDPRTNGPQSLPDIVIVLQGPEDRITVREKERVGGIWINQDSVTFKDAPGFVYVASSRPLRDMTERRVLARNHIGVDHVKLTPRRAERSEGYDPDADLPADPPPTAVRIRAFADALIRAQVRNGLYIEDPEGVKIRDGRLFRAEIDLPAQVPVGNYTAKVYLLRDGAIANAQTIPLFVERSSIEHEIHRFAHEAPLFYGIFAVIIAMLVGAGASALFRRP